MGHGLLSSGRVEVSTLWGSMEQRSGVWLTKKSQVPDYRCRTCNRTYNVYSQTVFEGRQLTPEQVVMVVRGIVKGEQAQILANEVGICRQTIQAIRKLMHQNAEQG